jgi:hypothetical protein
MEGEGEASQSLVVNGRRRRNSLCLVANGRKGRSAPMFGGQWKEKEKLLSPLFIFPPTNFTQTFIFSFNLKLLLYHGSRPLLMHFLPFL